MLRMALVRGSLILNGMLLLYLGLSWISTAPSQHSSSTRSVIYLSYPAAFHSQNNDVSDSGKPEAEPVFVPPIPLTEHPGITIQGDEGMNDVSLRSKTLGQLPDQAGAVNGGSNKEPVATEDDPPDPPLDSLERKIYPDLRECTAKPLQPFYQQRGDYWVLENYLPAMMSFRCDESITFATHGEYTFLDNLGPITSRWQVRRQMLVAS